MALILKLTRPKNDEPVRVNFENVAYYRSRREYTEIVFVSPNHYEQTMIVKETMQQVDRLLGI